MTLFFNINAVAATGSEAIFKLKGVLTASGWTVPSSSDGTTTNFVGVDQITIPGAGAGGMTNSGSWFVAREPGTSNRSWCFQRGSTSLIWRIKISPSKGFTGGIAAATRVPSAIDETIVWGAGSDITPTHATFLPTDGTYRWHAIADNTAVGAAGNTAYGFWAFSTISATGLNNTVVGQDPLVVGSYSPLTGSRSAPTSGEADPVVYYKMYGATVSPFIISLDTLALAATTDTLANVTACYYYKYNIGALSCPTTSPINGRAQETPAKFGTDPTSGIDVNGPIIWGRATFASNPTRATFLGLKGITTNLKLQYTSRNYPDTTDLSTNAKVYIGSCLLPWPTGSAPLL